MEYTVSGKKILAKKYKSWEEFENAVKSLNNAKDKGDAFEDFFYIYLNLKKRLFQVKGNEIYRRNELPSKLQKKLKLLRKHADKGTDFFWQKTDGKIWGCQVKFRSKAENLTIRELSPFINDSNNADGKLIFYNQLTISPDIAINIDNTVLRDKFESLDEKFFDRVRDFFLKNKILDKEKIEPHEYQKKMLKDIENGFKENDRGKLIAACGVGKTLVALWSTENLGSKKILYLAPSLALIKQTLDAWTDEMKNSFEFICVCSDKTIKQEREEHDYAEIELHELTGTVTTEHEVIKKFLNSTSTSHIVFSTYQSVDRVIQAQKNSKHKFDITIFDEAHRTVTAEEDTKALEGALSGNLKTKKRLFMTATERLISPRLKQKAKQEDYVIFSMDDEKIYGPVFHKFTFGQAIKAGAISDYKIIVIGEQDIDSGEFLKKRSVKLKNSTLNPKTIFNQFVLSKAMSTQDIESKKVISFHSSVKLAKDFISNPSLKQTLKKHLNVKNSVLGTIHAVIPTSERHQILNEFDKSDIGVISNCACLTEGVDIPVIDSVFFADPKKSLIDIVQAVGRTLRKGNKKKKFSYILLPLNIPNVSKPEEIPDENFETMINVIQAMRDQDERLAEQIEGLTLDYVRNKQGNRIVQSFKVILPEKITTKFLTKLRKSIDLKIVIFNSKHQVNPRPKSAVKRKSGYVKKFGVLGLYNVDTLKNNLCLPTLEKFGEKKLVQRDSLTINHNNISHTEKAGFIKKRGVMFELTQLGKKANKDITHFDEYFKTSMMNFCPKNSPSLYPYKAFLQIIFQVHRIRLIDFVYAIYTMKTSNPDDIKNAVENVKYIQDRYPNVSIQDDTSREILLNELNNNFNVEFTFDEAWGKGRTTVGNEFGYFSNHLSTISGIIVNIQEKTIEIDVSKKTEIRKVLGLNKR